MVHVSSHVFTALTLLSLAATVLLLLWQSAPVWRHEGLQYVAGTQWSFRHTQFGTLSMLYGTLAVAAIAIGLAGPVGIGAAIFIAEYSTPRARLAMKLLIELLAGIPSVVYGLLGVLLLRDYVYTALNWLGLAPLSGDSLLTAGLLLAVMILPTVMTLAEDALRAVPGTQRQAARGLGLSRGQTILTVAVPQAYRGLVAALLLALGRAFGETIAVFLVVGRQDNQWPKSLLSVEPLISAGQTLSTKLGGAETNIAFGDPLHWAAMVGLGLLLLSLAALVTVLGAWLQGRQVSDA